MESESELQTETLSEEDEREALWRCQNATASANAEIARAVERQASLIDSAHPVMDLSNSHDALLNAYYEVTRAIDRVEQTMDGLDEDYGGQTPRRIKDEHADRLEEQYEGPVLYLALMLLERNRREWLHRKPETNGAQAVRRHGLTENQRTWLNDLSDAWREYDGN